MLALGQYQKKKIDGSAQRNVLEILFIHREMKKRRKLKLNQLAASMTGGTNTINAWCFVLWRSNANRI